MVETTGIDIPNLLLVLALAWTAGTLVERLGYPALMGELLAGVVFGPPLLGLLHPAPELAILAELGVLLLMIYVGVEVDVQDLVELGPQAFIVAVSGFSSARRRSSSPSAGSSSPSVWGTPPGYWWVRPSPRRCSSGRRWRRRRWRRSRASWSTWTCSTPG